MKKGHIVLISSVIILLTTGIGIALYFHFKDSFKKRLIRIATTEASKWSAITELSQKASSYLIEYWKSVGLNFSPSQMQSPAVQSAYPWSSAFISWLFYKAGATDRFPYNSSHAGYFQKAKANRDNKNAPLRGFRVTEYAPKAGDLVVYTRESSKGYDSTGFFPAHGELVIETGKNYIKAIGGNVSNKVKVSTYTTDENGKLAGNSVPFFMVIQNNIK